MAAQFEDQRIPSKDNQQLFVELANGLYQITVSNLFEKDGDELDEEFDERAIHFQICIEPYSGDLSAEQTAQIHWFEEWTDLYDLKHISKKLKARMTGF